MAPLKVIDISDWVWDTPNEPENLISFPKGSQNLCLERYNNLNMKNAPWISYDEFFHPHLGFFITVRDKKAEKGEVINKLTRTKEI